MNLILSENKWLRIGSMTVFYVAQGLPIGLFLYAINAWLADNGQSAGAVAAIIATVYMPWSFKFIAAALMDRYTYLPMGRRRVWLIGSQALMLAGLSLAAFMAPGPQDLALIGWLGFAIFVGSAVQDVSVDGLAVDILPDNEQGPVSAFTFGGQAIGIAAGTMIGGYLLDHYGSAVAFMAFAPLNVFFLLFAVILRERPGEKLLPWTKGQASSALISRARVDWAQILKVTAQSLLKRDSIVMLIAQCFARAAGGAFTAFWPIYATTTGGWSTSGFTGMVGTVGLITSVACMIIGSALVSWLGARLSTVVTYAAYGVLALVYIFAPQLALITWIFVALTTVWNATDTLTSVCSNPLRMRLSDKRVAATQFTIYNSAANLVVPMGASAYAWAAGYGSLPSMLLIIGLTLLGCIGYAAMRIGGRGEHLEEIEERVN